MKNLAYERKLNQKNIYMQFYFKQQNSVIDVMTCNQIVEDYDLFWRQLPSCDITWLNVIIEM